MKPYEIKDKWALRAKNDGYRARSIYKLEELDRVHRLLRSGMRVLDLGAAPGSWLQYVSKKIGAKGRALGLDLKEIEYIAPNVKTEICDISKIAELDKCIKMLGWANADLILSDAMANTSGISLVDQRRSIELCENVFVVAKKWLKPRGKLVMKIFQGVGFDDLIKQLKKHFKSVKFTRTQATRRGSQEIYVVCR